MAAPGASWMAKQKKLQLEAAKLKKQLAMMAKESKGHKKCCAQVIKWIKAETEWSDEVTMMLRSVNWAKLAQAFPGGGGTNPPQTPPDWPPA